MLPNPLGLQDPNLLKCGVPTLSLSCSVGGGGHDGDAFFVFGCPGPLLLLKDLARLLWMYVTLFGLLTGGGLVSRHMSLIQTFDDRGHV